MSAIQPEWLYQVIVGLAEYEDTHPDPRRDGGVCLANLLNCVPKDIQRDAHLFVEGARRSCTCPLAEVTGLDEAKPRYTRGSSFGCPVHGDVLDDEVAEAIKEARR